MRTRAEAPGQVRGVLEPADPIVLTDVDGLVIAGPVFWDGDVARPQVDIEYSGPPLLEFCMGVLRPDGVLAWQGDVERFLYSGTVRLTLEGLMEPETLLLAEDHEWLRATSDQI